MKILVSVDTTDLASITEAIAYLSTLNGSIPAADKQVATQDDSDLDLDLDPTEGQDELVEEDDMLDGLMDEDEPEAPTVEDMKDAFKYAVKAKGKDASAAFIKKVLTKLGVAGMGKIADDKRQSFIDIVKKFADK